MFFRKKPKNKRHHRRKVLDVKLRTNQVRSARSRGIIVVAGALFATVFSLYVLWRSGEWLLDRLVYENAAFAIRQVEMSTDGEISIEQLRRWSGVKRGENLFALNLARVQRNLELVPNIQSVAVERLLPRGLRIRVTERKAVAQVNLPRLRPQGGLGVQVWLLDAEGMVMLPLNPAQRQMPLQDMNPKLPLLTGVAPTELRLGSRVESPRVLAALQMVDAFSRSEMAGLVKLQRVDVTEPGVLVAMTSDAADVTLRPRDFEPQFLRWREIHRESVRLHKVILSLDLAVKNNVPVRWVDAGTVAPGSRPERRSNRSRRSNV